MKHLIQERDIEAFLNALRGQERSAATLEKYARVLRDFFMWLKGRGADKETAMAYKAALAEKYSPAGVNAALAAVNGFFGFLGWHECRVRTLKIQRLVFSSEEKELTREEYGRLVETAERMGKARLSLLRNGEQLLHTTHNRM